jgi:hypothetical protein
MTTPLKGSELERRTRMAAAQNLRANRWIAKLVTVITLEQSPPRRPPKDGRRRPYQEEP